MTLSDEIKALVSTLEMQLNGFAKVAYEKDLRIGELESKLQEHDAMLGRRPCINNRCMDMVSAKSRIADLERQLAEASAPAVEQIGSFKITSEFAGYGVRNKVTGKWGDWLYQEHSKDYAIGTGDWSGPIKLYTAPQAADTDKVREAISKAPTPTYSTIVDRFEYGFGAGLKAASDIVATMAAQAPVREVPEGWKLTRCEDGTIIVSKNNIGGYAAWKDDSNIASSILYHFADEFLATVPAAPVQQEGASNG